MRSGEVLADRFVVEEHVSAGGSGSVYRGWDLEAEAPVAIKVIDGMSEPDIKRFRREAEILARVQVPGLVRHIHHGESEGTPYLVMEWLQRETVADRLGRVGFDLAETVALVRAVCAPLAELHRRGLVHRDIKPGNLMIGDSPEDIVVIDLGLVRATIPTASRVTQAGYVVGTPNHMAPEQVRGDAVIDARADVFALGCLLYECLTGHSAFTGDTILAVHTKILAADPPSLAASCPEVPDALERVIAACLAKPSEHRPTDAGALAAALAELGPLPAGPRRPWGAPRPPTEPTARLARR